MATAAESGRSDGPELPIEASSEDAVKTFMEEVDRQLLDYVRFTFADLHGIARCKSVPRQHVQHVVRTGGVSVYAGQLLLYYMSVTISNNMRN